MVSPTASAKGANDGEPDAPQAVDAERESYGTLVKRRTIGGPTDRGPADGGDHTGGGGRVLGTFRNTYYDFPRESDHAGAAVPLMSPSCKPISKVPRGFFPAVCVQGSGLLRQGFTVSFAKRDCAEGLSAYGAAHLFRCARSCQILPGTWSDG